ncbi:MAG: hypothetical protein BMS9Abin36_2256 [Gammaproteobacteria bacterium]|nr:MAG: hypothetical protein BMS9Abin36_2256 [Gammaproteobacteria bacterium]
MSEWQYRHLEPRAQGVDAGCGSIFLDSREKTAIGSKVCGICAVNILDKGEWADSGWSVN